MHTVRNNFKIAFILPVLLFCINSGLFAAAPFKNFNSPASVCVGVGFTVKFDINVFNGLATGTVFNVTTNGGSVIIGTYTISTAQSDGATISVPCIITSTQFITTGTNPTLQVSSLANGLQPVYGPTTAGTITVNPSPTLTPITPITICSSSAITILDTTSGGTAPYTYVWQNSPNGTAWANVTAGTPLNASYSYSTTDSLGINGISGISAPLSLQYRCIVSDASNCRDTSSTTLTVDSPRIAHQSPASVFACNSGNAVFSVTALGAASLSYQWQYLNAGTWSDVSNGLPAGANYTVATIDTQLTVSGIIATDVYSYRCAVWVTGGNCLDTSYSSYTLNVIAQPSITQQPTATQIICTTGTANFNVSATATGGTPTYQWQYNNAGIWGNVVNGTPSGSTYTNPTTNSFGVSGIGNTGSYQFRCIVSAIGNGCQPATSSTATVTVVNQPLAVTPSITNAEVCIGGSTVVTELPTAFGTGNVAYQWQYSANGTTWNGVTNNTPTGATYNATDSLLSIFGIVTPSTYYYRCNVAPSGSGCIAVNSALATLTIVSQPAVITAPVNTAPICIGGTTGLNISASGGTPAITYQWQYDNGGTWANVSNNLPTGSIYSNSNTDSLILNGIGTSGNNYQYRCLISALGSGCTSALSNSATVTVGPQAIATTPLVINDTICIGGFIVLKETPTAMGAGTLMYQWQYSPNGSTWANVTNSIPTNATYNAIADSVTITDISGAGTPQYRVQISPSGSGCVTQTSNGVTTNILADPSVSTPAFDPVICTGGANNASVIVTGGHGISSYQWQYSTSVNGPWSSVANNTPSGAAYTGATSSQLTDSGESVTGNPFYRCLVTQGTSGCISASAANGFEVKSGPSISTSSFVSICPGGSSHSIAIATGGTLPNVFQWQYDSLGTYVNVRNGQIPNVVYVVSTDSILNITGITNPGSYNFRCKLTQPNGSSCDAISAQQSLVVDSNPYITNEPVNFSSFCINGSDVVSLSASGGALGLTYKWYYFNGSNLVQLNANPNVPTTGATYSGYNTNSLTLSGINVAGNYQYLCNISAAGSGCSALNSDTITVTVVPQPTITRQATSYAICKGGITGMGLNAVNGTPSLTYQWQYSSGGVWANVSNGIPSGVSSYANQNGDSITITTNNLIDSGTYWYRCIVSATGSGCGSVISDSASITIVPNPYIVSHPLNPSPMCVGGAASINVTAADGTPSINYIWQYSADSINFSNVASNNPEGATYTDTSTNILNINNISAPGKYFYRCVVWANASGCADTASNSSVVNIVPNPTTNSISTTALICVANDTVIRVSATGGTPSLTYQWQYNSSGNWSNVTNGVPVGVSYASTTSNALSFNSDNTVPPGNYNYRCIVSSAGLGCQSTSDSSFIVVNQLPPLPTFGSEFLPICENATGVSMIITDSAIYNHYSAYTFQWSSSPTHLIATGLNSAHPTFDFANSGSYIISVTDYNSVGCSNSSTLSVTVSNVSAPTAIITMVTTGGTQSLILNDNTVNSYQWGYDDATTMQSDTIGGAIFQSFSGVLDTLHKHYWVIICDGNCCSKIYYNRGSTTSVIGLFENTAVRVYPNPTTGILTIEAMDAEVIQGFILCDLNGREIQRFQNQGSSLIRVALNDFDSGIYLGKVILENKEILTIKVVLQNQ